MRKVGLFGGTFNPIHLGHARLAYNVYNDFELDELIFIPAKLPPHKEAPCSTPEDRYNMVQLAAQELNAQGLNGSFSVSDFELKADGISYTYLTLIEQRRLFAEDALYFITGSDIFITIESWQKSLELFELSNFIVVNRDVSFEKLLSTLPQELLSKVVEYPAYKEPSKAGDIILYMMDALKTSSSALRSQFAKSDGIKEFGEDLLESVYKYIVEKKLYEY
ncbi:MAG: nicotinate-nucleotide adenylyltransferase [Deferribacteraceae bacterium]|jgi:nicotinate-nucleotide adenylyltransferase|nr:nicotinate-nucleotide adenylyltransferase [Deferribacteraceae bacterium]